MIIMTSVHVVLLAQPIASSKLILTFIRIRHGDEVKE